MRNDTTDTCCMETEDCKGRPYRKGLCARHYKATLDAKPNRPDCSEPRCPKKARVRGMCESHYEEWRAARGDVPRCSFEGGCPEAAVCLGLCQKHYQFEFQYRDGHPKRLTYSMSIEERFWHYTNTESGLYVLNHPELGQCWSWEGGTTRGGYGSFRVPWEKNPQRIHILSYEAFVGPIPDGLVLDHLCHTYDPNCYDGPDCIHRLCGNPAHLEPVTFEENIFRRREKQPLNKTHCTKGHEMTEENTCITMVNGKSWRTCVACRRYNAKRRNAAKRGIIIPELPIVLMGGPVSALKLADRDCWICQICFEPIDPTLSYPDPRYRSIDHIIQVSDNGPDTYENTRIAHLGCNQSRKRSPFRKWKVD